MLVQLWLSVCERTFWISVIFLVKNPFCFSSGEWNWRYFQALYVCVNCSFSVCGLCISFFYKNNNFSSKWVFFFDLTPVRCIRMPDIGVLHVSEWTLKTLTAKKITVTGPLIYLAANRTVDNFKSHCLLNNSMCNSFSLFTMLVYFLYVLSVYMFLCVQLPFRLLLLSEGQTVYLGTVNDARK